MAEPTQYMFTHKEVVEILVKQQGLHEGLWSLSVEFGINAVITGPNDDQLYPTAMVPVIRFGIQKSEKMNNISVDAALVNPAPKSKSKSPRTAKKKP